MRTDHDATVTELLTAALNQKLKGGQLATLSPLLPLLFSLNNRPYTLTDHFPFEPMFRAVMPRRILWRTARQVSKSTSMAARCLLLSLVIPNFSTLFVTLWAETVRRFSTQFVKTFIDQSPFRRLFVGDNVEQRVLQRSFPNHSRMFFSYLYRNPHRVRGIFANCCAFDEIQMIERGDIPIALEVMSGQKRRHEVYAGTPLTLDASIEKLWETSSQAEWVVPCDNCGYFNVPALGHDLERMIGPARDDISDGKPAVICGRSRCRLPINPRHGRWEHRHPERRFSFPGYHVPQIILPLHYASKERWMELLAKQQGASNYTPAKFYNEVLGEAYDVSTKLINETDLRRAACLPIVNDPANLGPAVARRDSYSMVAMGVDWGGGGEDELSFTTAAIVGLLPSGGLEVIYGEKLLTPHDRYAEAERLLRLYAAFRCSWFAHDYNGAGSVHEAIMVRSGIPLGEVVPLRYCLTGRTGIMVYKPPRDEHPRHYWNLDKPRSLDILCQAIKIGLVKFFQYDWISPDRPGLLADFLSLLVRKLDSPYGSELYTIGHSPSSSDDFAHAVNFAACALWHRSRCWPDFSLKHVNVGRRTGSSEAEEEE